MSNIDLAKRTEKVGIILAKRNVPNAPTVRVGASLDVSGSTQGLYSRGVMQETVERLAAIALKFDDNGELDMWSFDNSVTVLETATAENLNGYVNAEIMNKRISKWGGTSYAPPLKSALDKYFPEKSAAGGFMGMFKKTAPVNDSTPAMLLFVTDGECDDKATARKILEAAANKNVYFQMVGVGPSRYFDFLQKAADDLPNVGFVNMENLDMTDDDLYEQLISQEMCDWIKKFV